MSNSNKKLTFVEWLSCIPGFLFTILLVVLLFFFDVLKDLKHKSEKKWNRNT